MNPFDYILLGILLVLSTIGPAITLVVIANLLLGFADHLELQYLIYEEAIIKMPPIAPKPSRP